MSPNLRNQNKRKEHPSAFWNKRLRENPNNEPQTLLCQTPSPSWPQQPLPASLRARIQEVLDSPFKETLPQQEEDRRVVEEDPPTPQQEVEAEGEVALTLELLQAEIRTLLQAEEEEVVVVARHQAHKHLETLFKAKMEVLGEIARPSSTATDPKQSSS